MVPGLGAGPFDLVFEGNYEDRVVNATHYRGHPSRHGQRRDRARARSKPPTTAQSCCCTATWSGLRWPLAARFTAETPQLFGSPEGKYRLEGIWPYALTANGELFVPRVDR